MVQPYGQGLTTGAKGGEDPGTPGGVGSLLRPVTPNTSLMSEMQDEHHETSSPTVCHQAGETYLLQNRMHVKGTF